MANQFLSTHSQYTGKVRTFIYTLRLALGAILLTAKFYNDVFYSNLHLAKVAGLPLRDLNEIESQFLATIDYCIFISPEEYQRFELGLQTHSTNQTNTQSSRND